MRMLLKASIPVEKGNESFQSGTMAQGIQSLMETLKPEAAYFFPEDGKRTALFVFEMNDSSQLVPIVEPLFTNLDAAVHITPVMNSEDLERGFAAARG